MNKPHIRSFDVFRSKTDALMCCQSSSSSAAAAFHVFCSVAYYFLMSAFVGRCRSLMSHLISVTETSTATLAKLAFEIPEGSLPYPQDPVTGPYPEPDESIPHPQIVSVEGGWNFLRIMPCGGLSRTSGVEPLLFTAVR